MSKIIRRKPWSAVLPRGLPLRRSFGRSFHGRTIQVSERTSTLANHDALRSRTHRLASLHHAALEAFLIANREEYLDTRRSIILFSRSSTTTVSQNVCLSSLLNTVTSLTSRSSASLLSEIVSVATLRATCNQPRNEASS